MFCFCSCLFIFGIPNILFATALNVTSNVTIPERMHLFPGFPSQHEKCHMCVNDLCAYLPETQCQYNVRAGDVMNEESRCDKELGDNTWRNGTEREEIKRRVDDVLYDFVEQAAGVADIAYCLPLVSQYTDCHKDNICFGCNVCACNLDGLWVCRILQRCSPAPASDTMHKFLALVIDVMLKNDSSNINRNNITISNKRSDPKINIFQKSHPPKVIKREAPKGKRQISKVDGNTKIQTDAFTSIEDLKSNALYPLIHIIADKSKEVNKLKDMKKYLIEYLDKKGDKNVSSYIYNQHFNDNETNSKQSFVIYKLESFPTPEHSLRSNPQNMLERITKRIKHNMFQLSSDINSLQRIMQSQNKKLPEELLKILMAARYYFSKQRKGLTSNAPKVISRRPYDLRGSLNGRNDIVTKIIKNRNNNIESKNQLLAALENSKYKNICMKNTLSNNSHRILERITTLIYSRYISALNIESLNHYKIGNDLHTIGPYWLKLSHDISTSNISNRLPNLKLLHLALSADIEKIQEVITYINTRGYQHNTLMFNNDELKYAVHKIDYDFLVLSDTVRKYCSRANKQTSFKSTVTKHNADKESVMRKLGKAIRGSRDEFIMNLKKKFHYNLPKALTQVEINNLNKRKMDNYESVMLDWQNKLDINKRVKRSPAPVDTKLKKMRLRYIIPKYLSGKMHHVFKDKTAKKTSLTKMIYKKL